MEIEYNHSNFSVVQHLDENDDIQYKRKGAKIVKNYLIGEVLGEGAYGKVKDAMDTFTQKRVAVKILKRARLKKIPGGEASVLKEINITKKLYNKHIIKLIDHFTIDEKGKLYIVYEHIGGGTLQNLLESAPLAKLPPAQAQNIFNQLIDAIDYIHSQKILHRDIKPDNILFTCDGILKLTDFGVAEDSSQLDDLECLSRSYGSPAFQPPELTSFQRSFSPFKIDIWAMGVTLYLMTIGKFPFYGTNMYQLFENISKCNIDFPPNIDKDLCSLIKGILQIDQTQRFTIEQIKKHTWCTKNIQSDQPFIEIPQESDFDPLVMAYGGGDEEDLIFGYEDNDSYSYQNVPPPMQLGSSIPTNPPPTINGYHHNGLSSPSSHATSLPCNISTSPTINNNDNLLCDDRSSTSSTPIPLSHQHHPSSDNCIPDSPPAAHDLQYHLVHLNQPVNLPSPHTLTTIIENYENTSNSNNNTNSSGNRTPIDPTPPTTNHTDSPPPPLRNSSVRRPKITFESPHNKSKCIVQ